MRRAIGAVRAMASRTILGFAILLIAAWMIWVVGIRRVARVALLSLNVVVALLGPRTAAPRLQLVRPSTLEREINAHLADLFAHQKRGRGGMAFAYNSAPL